MLLGAQTNSILSLIMPLVMPCIFNPSCNNSFTVWEWQAANNGSQNIAAARDTAFMMQINLGSKSSNYHNRFSLTAVGQPHCAKLRSTSSQAWLLTSGQELINVVSKVRLWSVILCNEPKDGNKQKISLALVKRWKVSSDKACLNVLRVVNGRWGGVGPSIERGDKRTEDPGTGADTRRDDETVGVPKWARRGNKQMGDLKQDDKGAKDLGQETRARRDNKKAVEPAVGACTEA